MHEASISMKRISSTRPSEDVHGRAQRLLREMAALLDEGVITERIDEPVDSAVASFPFSNPSEYDHRRFHDLIVRFIQHLAACMVWRRGELSYDHAHDEAVALLERLYDGEHGRGYDGAVADAADPEGWGIPFVLLVLAEGIKSQQRALYARWVESRCLAGADWGLRCAAAEILLGRCRPMLSPMVQDWPAERWADQVFALLMVDMQTEISPRR